jgi:hypothetical protein
MDWPPVKMSLIGSGICGKKREFRQTVAWNEGAEEIGKYRAVSEQLTPFNMRHTF